MARPARHPDIGAELIAARANGVPWKVLVRLFGLKRTRLWQLWRAAVDATEMTWPGMER